MRRPKSMVPPTVSGYVVSYDDGRERQEMNFTAGEREAAHHVARQKAGKHYRAAVLEYSSAGCGLDGQYMRGSGGIVTQTGGTYGVSIPKGWATLAG